MKMWQMTSKIGLHNAIYVDILRLYYRFSWALSTSIPKAAELSGWATTKSKFYDFCRLNGCKWKTHFTKSKRENHGNLKKMKWKSLGMDLFVFVFMLFSLITLITETFCWKLILHREIGCPSLLHFFLNKVNIFLMLLFSSFFFYLWMVFINGFFFQFIFFIF